MTRLHPRLERTQASGFGRLAAPAGAPMRAASGSVRPIAASRECLTNRHAIGGARRDRDVATPFTRPLGQDGSEYGAAPQGRQPRDNFGAGDPGGLAR